MKRHFTQDQIQNMRYFNTDQLEKQVALLLPEELPEGKHLAVVGGITVDGVQAAAVWKYSYSKTEWRLIADYKHTWAGDNTIGAKIIGYI